jgi:chromate transport protein ChrA
MSNEFKRPNKWLFGLIDYLFSNFFLERIIYYVLPSSLLITPFIFFAMFKDSSFYFAKEAGLVEKITAIILLLAVSLTVKTFLNYRKKNQIFFQAYMFEMPYAACIRNWIIIYAIGCIYFLGEEISWGQHISNWATPEIWMTVNNQQETNLHNISALFDQLPRFILTTSIIIAGFFLPILYRKKVQNNGNLSSLDEIILPGFNCITAASTVFLISIHDKFYSFFSSEIPVFLQINDGEVKESLIAMFLLVYIYEFNHRLKYYNLTYDK